MQDRTQYKVTNWLLSLITIITMRRVSVVGMVIAVVVAINNGAQGQVNITQYLSKFCLRDKFEYQLIF